MQNDRKKRMARERQKQKSKLSSLEKDLEGRKEHRNRTSSSEDTRQSIITRSESNISDDSGTTSDDFQANSSKEQASILKLLLWYRQLFNLIIENESTDQIKNDLQWVENNLNSTFHELVDVKLPQFPSVKLPTKFKSWKEFKDAFEVNFLIKKDENSNNSINLIRKDEIKDDRKNETIDANKADEKETNNKTKEDEVDSKLVEEKAWASLTDRPRRSCTLKKQMIDPPSPSPPIPVKKLKTSDNTKSNNNVNKKRVEELVVNCDPFKCLPGSSNSNFKNKTATTSIPTITKVITPTTTTPSAPVAPNIKSIVPLKIVGSKVYMPIAPKSPITISAPNHQQIVIPPQQSSSQRPLVNQPRPITPLNSQPCPLITNNNKNPVTFPPLISIKPNHSFKGKVLLINSVPCLVQNGNQIQLPMIPSNPRIICPPITTILPNTKANSITTNNLPTPMVPTNIVQQPLVKQHSSVEKNTNDKVKEVIKIEDESDEEDSKTRVQEEIKEINSNTALTLSSNNISTSNQKQQMQQQQLPSRKTTNSATEESNVRQNNLVVLKNNNTGPRILLSTNKSPRVGNLVNVPISSFQNGNFKIVSNGSSNIGSSSNKPNKFFSSKSSPVILKPKESSSNISKSCHSASSISRKLVTKISPIKTNVPHYSSSINSSDLNNAKPFNISCADNNNIIKGNVTLSGYLAIEDKKARRAEYMRWYRRFKQEKETKEEGIKRRAAEAQRLRNRRLVQKMQINAEESEKYQME